MLGIRIITTVILFINMIVNLIKYAKSDYSDYICVLNNFTSSIAIITIWMLQTD